MSYSENINRGLQKHPFKPLDFDFHTSVSLAVLRRAPSSARGISCFFLVIHIASPLLYVEVVYYTTTERKHLNCFYRAINVVSDNFYLSCSQGEYNESKFISFIFSEIYGTDNVKDGIDNDNENKYI